jgi:ribosomal-protein-alanine N-acetyltransferase
MADIHARSFAHGWPALDMAVHIKNDLCLGAGDPIKGFIILRASETQAEILTFAVHPAQRREGQGRALLDGALAELSERGVQTVFLEVAEDNQAAISLYRAAGFTGIGRRPAYYRRENGRVAALTLSKTLDA